MLVYRGQYSQKIASARLTFRSASGRDPFHRRRFGVCDSRTGSQVIDDLPDNCHLPTVAGISQGVRSIRAVAMARHDVRKAFHCPIGD